MTNKIIKFSVIHPDRTEDRSYELSYRYHRTAEINHKYLLKIPLEGFYSFLSQSPHNESILQVYITLRITSENSNIEVYFNCAHASYEHGWVNSDILDQISSIGLTHGDEVITTEVLKHFMEFLNEKHGVYLEPTILEGS